MPNLNIVICPGCGSELPVDNCGCPDCNYENNDDGRLLTIAEMLDRPSYPAPGAIRLNDVSPAFLKALITAVQIDTLKEAGQIATEIGSYVVGTGDYKDGKRKAYQAVAGEMSCKVERLEKAATPLIN